MLTDRVGGEEKDGMSWSVGGRECKGTGQLLLVTIEE